MAKKKKVYTLQDTVPIDVLDGLTVAAYISIEGNRTKVTMTNLRVWGVSRRGIGILGEYDGKIYYDDLTPLMFMFLVVPGYDAAIIQNRLWTPAPLLHLG